MAVFDAYVVYTLCQKELSDEFVTDLEAHSPEGLCWNASTEDITALKLQSLVVLVRCLTRLGAIDDARVMWKELREVEGEDSTNDVDHLQWTSILRGPDHESQPDLIRRILETSSPSKFGLSRREILPWSHHESDRNTPDSLTSLNTYLATIAPNLEARLTALPAFDSSGIATGEISHQLGLFAKIDLEPGQEILREKSMLTAIRPLEDALCDACGQDLEGVSFDEVRGCEGVDCDVTFCSVECKEKAVEGYHRPSIEDGDSEDEDEDEAQEDGEDDEEDVETSEAANQEATNGIQFPNATDNEEVDDNKGSNSTVNTNNTPFCGNQDLALIGRPTNTITPEWDLYFLLLTRTLAMSITQNIHPLELPETKYLWGDFNESMFDVVFPSQSPSSSQPSSKLHDTDTDTKTQPLPTTLRTLPFSLTHTIINPLEYLTTLSLSHPQITPYTRHWLTRFDPSTQQLLHAKYRGVANATQSTFDGQPEIAAVHAGWCLANHSCEPNVKWDGVGGVRRFFVRERDVDVSGQGVGEERRKGDGKGIRTGEEIWSHYTDVRLDVVERRERLRGVLGGICMCGRCLREAGEAKVGGKV